MISLNDVLLAMSNIPVSDPIAEIWGRGLQGGYKIIEYTGALPIAISANGDALLDYRIYGSDGGVGEPTESGEPAGYKLPMTVTSKNLFDKNAKDVNKGYTEHKVFSPDGSIGGSIYYDVSEYMQVEPLKEYFLENFHNPGWPRTYYCACFYDSDKNVLSVIRAGDADSLILLAPELAKFIRISVYFPTCKFYDSVPQKENVYIGENQLDAAGEYVSYSDGKIYRMVGGTLTPTDPPVSFPDIPTIDGETVIDYDGEPKPSQMYVKYKGKG